MRINFVLPGFSPAPIGGYAVVYEYANQLSQRGHEIKVIHPADATSTGNLARRAALRARHSLFRLTGRSSPLWFDVKASVELLMTPSLREIHIPDSDITVATAWQTAKYVERYSDSKGKKFYLIQHYETWSGPESEVRATWTSDMHKIVISKWLQEIGRDLQQDQRLTYIPNGLDLDQYRLVTPIEDRFSKRVGMMYHPYEWKGSPDGIAALIAAKEEFPELQAVVFGSFPRPAELPKWVDYVRGIHGDELVGLYNSLSIFLHPSWAEGWPLPPAEAMACGCALVAAANPGVSDYATDNETALMAPIREPRLLSERLLVGLRDDALRRRIAVQGHQYIQQFTWSRAADALEDLFVEALS